MTKPKRLTFTWDRFDGGLADYEDARRIGPAEASTAYSTDTSHASLTAVKGVGTTVTLGYTPGSSLGILKALTPMMPDGFNPSSTTASVWRFWLSATGGAKFHAGSWFFTRQISSETRRVAGVLGAGTDWQAGASDPRDEQCAQVWYPTAPPGRGQHYEVAGRVNSTATHNRVTNGSSAKFELVAGAAPTLTATAGGSMSGITVYYCYALIYRVLGSGSGDGLQVLSSKSSSANVTVTTDQYVKIQVPAHGLTLPGHVSVEGAIVYRRFESSRGGDDKWYRIATVTGDLSGATYASFDGDRRDAAGATLTNCGDNQQLDSFELSVDRFTPWDYVVQLPVRTMVGMATFRQMAVGWVVNASGTSTASTIYFSWPGRIQLWDPTFRVDVRGEIYHFIEMNGVGYVFTSSGVYAVTGSSDQGSLRADAVAAPPAIYGTAVYCQDMNGIIYLSRQGVIFLSASNQVVNLTAMRINVVTPAGGSDNDYLLSVSTTADSKNHAAAYFQGRYYVSKCGDANGAGLDVVYVADMTRGMDDLRWSKIYLNPAVNGSGVTCWLAASGGAGIPQALYVGRGVAGSVQIDPWGTGDKLTNMQYVSGTRTMDPPMPFYCRAIRGMYTLVSGETLTLDVMLDGSAPGGKYQFTFSTAATDATFDFWLPEDRWANQVGIKVQGKGTLHNVSIDVTPVSYGRSA